MKLLLALLISSCAPAFAQNSGQVNSATYNPGISGSKNYVKNPDCAKSATTTSGITASGGSLAKGTTTPLNEDSGSECTIDASSSGQTYTWALNTFGQNLKGQNCEARFTYEGDASYYKAYIKNGSTQITTDLTLSYPTYTQTASINFPCGDLSASNTFVIEATNNAAAAISVGKVYVGLATNLSNVAQASFVGSLKYAGTANCAWSSSSTSLAAFSADTDCPTPSTTSGSGTVSAPGTKIPGIVASNLGPGVYKVIIKTAIGKTGTQDAVVAAAVNDGTTTSPAQTFYNSTNNGTVVSPLTLVAYFTYTSAKSSVTFQAYGYSQNASNAVTLEAGNTNRDFEISIERFPTQSEIALRQNQTPWYIDATMDGANPSLGTSAQSSYVEITDAGLTLKPQTGSAAVGVMCSSTNAATAPSTGNTTCAAGSESVGINFSIPVAGAYEVCFYGGHAMDVDSGEYIATTFQLIETPTNAQTLTLEGGSRTQSSITGITIATGTAAGSTLPLTNCSIFNWTSSGTKGVRLMYEQGVGGTPNSNTLLGDANAGFGQRNMRWAVKPITNQQPQPLLVGSVTSNSSGMERVERAQISNNGSTCTVATQSGSWISSCTRNSTGKFTLTIATGIFSGQPSCTISETQTIGGDLTASIGSTSSTSVVYYTNQAGTLTDNLWVDIICMGPR